MSELMSGCGTCGSEGEGCKNMFAFCVVSQGTEESCNIAGVQERKELPTDPAEDELSLGRKVPVTPSGGAESSGCIKLPSLEDAGSTGVQEAENNPGALQDEGSRPLPVASGCKALA